MFASKSVCTVPGTVAGSHCAPAESASRNDQLWVSVCDCLAGACSSSAVAFCGPQAAVDTATAARVE